MRETSSSASCICGVFPRDFFAGGFLAGVSCRRSRHIFSANPGGMSESRRHVRLPAACPASGGMSESRRHVRIPAACPAPGGMSESQRHVRLPGACPNPGGMSGSRGHVRLPAACPAPGGMSESRRHVRIPQQRPATMNREKTACDSDALRVIAGNVRGR